MNDIILSLCFNFLFSSTLKYLKNHAVLTYIFSKVILYIAIMRFGFRSEKPLDGLLQVKSSKIFTLRR